VDVIEQEHDELVPANGMVGTGTELSAPERNHRRAIA
jgi:hypothetical protein